MAQLFREVKVSGDEGLARHVSCDGCSWLKQQPARRQVAIAHVEMLDDVETIHVHFWTLKQRHSREKFKTAVASRILDRTTHDLRTTFCACLRVGWQARPDVSEWIPMFHRSAGNVFDQAEQRGIFEDPVQC